MIDMSSNAKKYLVTGVCEETKDSGIGQVVYIIVETNYVNADDIVQIALRHWISRTTLGFNGYDSPSDAFYDLNVQELDNVSVVHG